MERNAFNRNRPRVLAIVPAFIPSTTLMVVKPLTNLHRAGQIVADITLEPWVSARQMDRADVIAFSRNTDPAVLDLALASGKPIIYNLDDNLLEIPASDDDGLEKKELGSYLRTANLVRAYSEPLKNYLQQFNSRVETVECAVDWRLIPSAPPQRDNKTISIVYATSRWQTDRMPSLFLDDLCKLLESHDHVRAFFWGYHPKELRGYRNVRFIDFTPNYDKFLRRFANDGFDIGLAPLVDDDFHRSKCPNKFREYAASRVAGIYSDVSVYSSVVEHERTGLLVPKEPGAWFAAMSRLIRDNELRQRIQTEAHAVARARYTSAKDEDVWLKQIERLVNESTAHRDSPVSAERVVASRSIKRTSTGLLGLTRRMCSQLLLLLKIWWHAGAVRAYRSLRLQVSTISQLARVRLALINIPARDE